MRQRRIRLNAFILAATVSLAGAFAARADIYLLNDDGQVTGELINKEDAARKDYVIRTADGAIVTVAKTQIKSIIPQNDAEAEYNQVRPTFADTAEDQTRLADWCRDHSLSRQRQAALERVVELEPENRAARLALGYRQINGHWMTQEQLMREQGKVYYQGDWVLQQEVEVLERRKKDELASKQWFQNLKKLRVQLDDPARADQAREALHKINDPLAAAALIQGINSERDRTVRIWYVETLGRVGPGAGLKTLVNLALNDQDPDVRVASLNQLTGRMAHEAVPSFVTALRSDDNDLVNRAGWGLGKLGDPSAIVPLIEALVTTHKYSVPVGPSGPGAITAGFSSKGGGGFSTGPSYQVVKEDKKNQGVLDALSALSGGENFGFDKGRWRNWYASQSRSSMSDTRRD